MNKENLIKKLIYRSIHRGCKETDFLIGKFASENLVKLTLEELNLFDAFLQEDDLRIYDWILSKELEPEKYSTLVAKIRKFHDITS